jgi:S1-C subfamily serine protease
VKDLRNRVAESAIGTPVSMDILRAGKAGKVKVVMEEEPAG